jgi:fatty acid/phospholipid biosynthesis enzyme
VKLEKEEERLDREEEETLAKLLRLRKQKRLIRTRGKDMLRRGLKTLDELEAAEEADRVAAEKAERALEAEPSGPLVTKSRELLGDFPFVDSPPLLAMSPASWERLMLDVGVSTPRAAHG